MIFKILVIIGFSICWCSACYNTYKWFAWLLGEAFGDKEKEEDKK